MESSSKKSVAHHNRTISLDFAPDTYNETVNDKTAFRKHVHDMIALYPELFPCEISDGYQLKEMRYSKKQNIVFIKIRDRAKKKFHDIFMTVSSKLWDCYHADSKNKFSQRVRRLHEWCKNKKVPDVILNPITKLRKHITDYSIAYDHHGAHRTSNMLDRLMKRMDRHLFATQYFHGSIDSAELSIRGWALIQNFAPSNPQTIRKYQNYQSPAERLNTFRYHENWLHNLMISAFLGGCRTVPPNPL